ncbi:MbcA/ParS/Xre antitoxin family protein [Syntrophomonas palmitatica]|uniref:MbcA/ParS/Xre antitoxin family protein n=1 Tax=Syntrophomonas palmitatica TaxID=402877 RepID=UPI0034E2F52C
MNLSYLSVYEVVAAKDFYLELRDIFLDKKCEVLLKEPWEESDDKPEALILGRVVQMADANLFSGMVLMLENDAGQKDFLTEHINHAAKVQNTKAISLLKFNGELSFGLFNHAFKKNFINLNHIAAAHINPDEAEALAQNLNSSNDYILWHETAGLKWFKPRDNDRGYIRIVLAGENLIISAEVLEDIEALRNLIHSSLPDLEFTVLSDTFMNQAPPVNMMGLWFTVIKDRETEKWLAASHPELEGKTPAEILKESDGKERLERMLAQMESKIQNEEARELVEYMRLRIA